MAKLKVVHKWVGLGRVKKLDPRPTVSEPLILSVSLFPYKSVALKGNFEKCIFPRTSYAYNQPQLDFDSGEKPNIDNLPSLLRIKLRRQR